MFKRSTFLAMAACIVAVLAPAPASAAWKHHNTEIVEDTTISLSGPVKFQTGNGGSECQITSTIQFLAGQTTGTAATFAPQPNETSCTSNGTYAPCQTHNLTPQVPNWTIHTDQWETTEVIIHNGKPGGVTVKKIGETHQAILITTQPITAQATGLFCPGKHILFTAGTIAAVPIQPNTFSTVQLNGTLNALKQTNSGAVDQEQVRITGTLQIEAENQQNTYSI